MILILSYTEKFVNLFMKESEYNIIQGKFIF